MRNGIFILATTMCITSILLYNILFYLLTIKTSAFNIVSSRQLGEDKGVTGWYPPNSSWITDLAAVVNGSGVHGFLFNDSKLPNGVEYGTYNWCNMPHVRASEYKKAGDEYQLLYVEIIHRHHKRTPYADNMFPKETYSWSCSDAGLFTYGSPLNLGSHHPAQTYWNITTSPLNPFVPAGFPGSCQFPQITSAGLEDSWQHGKDLLGVYHALLNFLPNTPDETVVFRVTNNQITSQVAGMLVNAMYPSHTGPFALQIQPVNVDSLEPQYPCPSGRSLYSSYSVGSNNTAWNAHLNASAPLFKALDAISGVSPSSTGFHQSWDHYFDNLSARQCHAKPLPCNITTPSLCVTQEQADEVYRLGQYEYSYIYRGAPDSLVAATSTYGIYIVELTHNIRGAISGTSKVKYRHNIAHDGSVSRLLSILQVDVMVWPGMGSEVVFEVFKKKKDPNAVLIRVLWGGKVLRSSRPELGLLNLVPADVLLGYLEGLVGEKAEKVLKLCS